MNMINWLSQWLATEETKLLYVLSLIVIANMIDFLMGWINARLNKEVKFSSSKARHGIAGKLLHFIILVYFIPVAMLVPEPIGVSALYVLYIGYLLSELNSILSHMKITSDDKQSEMFADFIQKIFKSERDGEK